MNVEPQGPRPRSRWSEDFPIRQTAEHRVSRREFAKFLGLASLVFFAGTSWLMGRRAQKHSQSVTKEVFVANTDEIKIGGYKLFRYPTPNDPAILVRLEEDQFAAYSQSCTHLSCPVHFQAATREMFCPCHDGHFSAENGRVLAGPPQRALPRFPLTVRAGKIFIIENGDAPKDLAAVKTQCPRREVIS